MTAWQEIMKTRLVIVLMASAAIKLAAMAEWPPLYKAFLLLPANVLAFFTGSDYAESLGVYTFPGFILDYSCAGVHFFIVIMLVGAFTEHKLVASVLVGYAVTLVANTFRVGLFLRLLPVAEGRPWLHEVIGTAVFMTFLIVFYTIMNRQGKHAESV